MKEVLEFCFCIQSWLTSQDLKGEIRVSLLHYHLWFASFEASCASSRASVSDVTGSAGVLPLAADWKHLPWHRWLGSFQRRAAVSSSANSPSIYLFDCGRFSFSSTYTDFLVKRHIAVPPRERWACSISLSTQWLLRSLIKERRFSVVYFLKPLRPGPSLRKSTPMEGS